MTTTLTAADTVSAAVFVPKGRKLRLVISGTYVATAILERKVKGGGWAPVFTYSASATEDRLIEGEGQTFRLRMTKRTSGTLTYAFTTPAATLYELRDPNGTARLTLDQDGALSALASISAGLLALCVEDGLTAHAGGTQAAGLALDATKGIHNVTTVGSAADSVLLPAAVVGAIHLVANSAASNSMQVFGAGTDTINGVATATGVAQAAGKTALYVCVAAGKWLRLLSA